MRKYQQPEINQAKLSVTNIIAVSSRNSEILDVHFSGVEKIFSHEWKDSWN